MSDDIDAEGGSAAGPIYAIELREREKGADVALVRISGRASTVDQTEDVWTNRFASLEAAQVVMHVMATRHDRWAGWVRMADILGAEFLTGLIEAEVVQAGNLDGEPERRHGSSSSGKGSPNGKDTINVSLMLEGVPRIVASRRGRRFMVLRFDTVDEAWRVWDWVRWQAGCLKQWYDLFETQGVGVLRRLILVSVFAEERRARAAGVLSDEGRPLRYWRPPGRADPDDRRDSGSDDT